LQIIVEFVFCAVRQVPYDTLFLTKLVRVSLRFTFLSELYQQKWNFRPFHMRAVRKVSSHFEYFENRSDGLGVTWQPLGGDLTVRRWTVTVPWG